VPQVYKGRTKLLNANALPRGRSVMVRVVYNRMRQASLLQGSLSFGYFSLRVKKSDISHVLKRPTPYSRASS
ncbi:hypothetical protein, partial [Cupriavidus sp. 8B]